MPFPGRVAIKFSWVWVAGNETWGRTSAGRGVGECGLAAVVPGLSGWFSLSGSLGELPAAAAIGGITLGLVDFIQVEEGGMDDFVFVDQSGAGQGFACEPVVGAVSDGGQPGWGRI